MSIDWADGARFRFKAGDAVLEGQSHGRSPDEAATIILLHEGLGSAELWRRFPQELAASSGLGVFVYSRQGYGRSEPVGLPRPLDYMEREAVDVLPQVLDVIGSRRVILLGHSDGASIAALYLGNFQDPRVRSLILMAPHFFTEPVGLRSIAESKVAYETGDLRERLAKYHDDVEGAFRGWNDTWLDPEFQGWDITDALDYIRVPVLAIQGRNDCYGTLAQIQALETRLYSPLEVVILDNCGHSPFIDQPDETHRAVTDFVARLERIEAAEVELQ